jgi:L-gulonate 3-dehydrogenase
MPESTREEHCIGIIGAGSIGVAWAVVFTTAGYRVRLYDLDRHRLDRAREEFTDRIAELKKFGLVTTDIDCALDLLSTETDIKKNISEVIHIQECIPEIKEEKKKLFSLLSGLVPESVPIASSTSFLPISTFATEIKNPERCLVIHPGNPPYLLRVAEIVPGPLTSPSIVDASVDLMRHAGMHPIVLKKETNGFVFNRLQGALLNEAYSLVEDGVASVEDIDTIVKDGLGLRWSIVGPFETVDLNTRGGIRKHAERMGPTYQQIGAERGTSTSWMPALIDLVESERRSKLPLNMWEERVRWRDRAMMVISVARRNFLEDN